jgi:Collagen triple helix repeat (20 copies)
MWLSSARHLRRNLVAYVALLFALGGTSYAAATTLLPPNSVGTRQVINGSLLKKDFKAGQLPRGARGRRGPVGAAGSTGPAGPAGPAGSAGAQGPKGDKCDEGEPGQSAVGTFGPVHITGREDTGCVTDEPTQTPWALDNENRLYVVDASQDGKGYTVTRYDLHGTFTAIVGRQHPGCADSGTFATPTEGTWNGVWTQQVVGNFDYNPDAAMPADPSWDSFLTAVFGVTLADTTFVSYEFDYYACGGTFHWRDANYNGSSQQSGTIGDC